MSRLFCALSLVTMIFGYAACQQEGVETDDAIPGPAGGQVDTILGPGGGLVMTPNKKACILVPDSAMVGVGDSVRITIRRLSPSDSTLPAGDSLPSAFRNAAKAGRRVFAPMYDFKAFALPANSEVHEFTKPIFVGMCVWADPPELFPARLAHPDPDNPETLELFDPLVTPPCSLKCPHGGGPPGGESARVEALERWFGGTPLTPTPAHASPAEGIGGKGDGPSPIAAVKP